MISNSRRVSILKTLPDGTKRRIFYGSRQIGIDEAERKRRYREKYPEKTKAHYQTSYAIKNGTLVPKPCEVCGSLPTEAHHEDYSKPLEVKWLCEACHKKNIHKSK